MSEKPEDRNRGDDSKRRNHEEIMANVDGHANVSTKSQHVSSKSDSSQGPPEGSLSTKGHDLSYRESSLEQSAVIGSNQIQAANWAGSIPVVLSLAPSSVSSPTLPPPIHVMVGRHNYLHLALEDAVRSLHQFAPMTLFFKGGLIRSEPKPGESFEQKIDGDANARTQQATAQTETNNTKSQSASDQTPYPVCWFEDEDSQVPLRWHLFAGVLFDLKKPKKFTPSVNDNTINPQSIPWKIRLHFTAAYPSTEILPLERGQVPEQVRHYYKNSLKQALCIQTGNNKAAMNLNKENHGRLWDSIGHENYSLYQRVQQESFSKITTTRIPVRLLIDDKVPIQRPCMVEEATGQEISLGHYVHKNVPALFPSPSSSANASIEWKVSGLSQPPLEVSLLALWQDFCHPDQFLHIVVLSN